MLNLAVAHLPSHVTRDYGEDNDNKGKKRPSSETHQGNAQKLIARALSGFHSEERMNLLRNKDEQTKKMVEIATQRHGFDKDKHELMMDNLALERDSKILEKEAKLTVLLDQHSEKLKVARHDLQEFCGTSRYDSDSSPAKEKKAHLKLYKGLYKKTFDELKILTEKNVA